MRRAWARPDRVPQEPSIGARNRNASVVERTSDLPRRRRFRCPHGSASISGVNTSSRRWQMLAASGKRRNSTSRLDRLIRRRVSMAPNFIRRGPGSRHPSRRQVPGAYPGHCPTRTGGRGVVPRRVGPGIGECAPTPNRPPDENGRIEVGRKIWNQRAVTFDDSRRTTDRSSSP